MKVVNTPYAFDLGNGFSKRIFDGETVFIEPSMYSISDGGYQLSSEDINIVRVFDRDVYIGNDAYSSGKKPYPIVGDMDRYENQAFKEALFGFIAKDFKQDVVLNLLVLGLPIMHFDSKKDDLVRIAKDKKVVTINGEKITVDIKNVLVYPQPIGTYAYVKSQKQYDLNDSKILVIDGGHGTLDLTAMYGARREKWTGERLGMVLPYDEIHQFLSTQFGSLNVTKHEIGRVLLEGIKVSGDRIDITKFEKVNKILDIHFENVMNFAQEPFVFSHYDYIIFTGGMSLVHKNRINAIKQRNWIIIENPQEANVLGYHILGRAWVKKNAIASSIQGE